MGYICLLYLLLFIVLSAAKANNKNLSSLSWIGGKFIWRCAEMESKYKCSGKYIKKNIIATNGQIYKNNLFLALPRFRPGVPATLVNFTLQEDLCDVLFSPYPNFKHNVIGECKALQNVVDVFLDSEDILWVLDTGIVNTMENATKKCPPKVIAYNMETNKMEHVVDLSKMVSKSIKSSSRLQFVVTEYSTEGNPFVYISDATGRSILAYDIAVNKFYKLELPKRISVNVETCKVLYLLLVHKNCGSYLIFTYLSSCHLYQIRTDHLFEKNFEEFIEDLGPKKKNTVFLGSYNNFVFFRYTDERDVYKWDSNKLFIKENFLNVYSTEDEEIATQVMVENKGKNFRVLESNFPDFIHGNVAEGAFQRISVISEKKTCCEH